MQQDGKLKDFLWHNRTMGNKTRSMNLQHIVENSEFWGPLKKYRTSFGKLWKATEDFGCKRGLAIIIIFIIN